jgi:hypothetical protein
MKTSSSTGFRYLRPFLISVALLGAAGLGLAYANAWQAKSEAARLLAVLSTVKVGSSRESEVLEGLKPFSRFEDSDPQRNERGVSYTFRNRVMAFLHLAPPKFVYAGIEFRDGIVVKKSVNFYQEPRFGVVVQEVMASGASDPTSNNPRQLRTNVYGPKSTVIDVHDDTSVPLSRRQLDWQIDFSCMTTMNFCANPQEMLPGIFPR